MIYSQTRYYVRCDECGETIETNAANEKIACETAQREGWNITELDYRPRVPMNYMCTCPKCKERKK